LRPPTLVATRFFTVGNEIPGRVSQAPSPRTTQDRAGPCGLGDGPAGAVRFPGSHPVVETRLPGRGTLTVHAAVGASVAAGAAGVRLPALRCTVLAVER